MISDANKTRDANFDNKKRVQNLGIEADYCLVDLWLALRKSSQSPKNNHLQLLSG
ncbi:MAG: hypothetical protein KAH18_11485 [Psychromonas sp.]|nr:hypothetical protein [Psychromonas sp.]